MEDEEKVMEWFVYRYNINSQKIERFNIFKKKDFQESIKSILNCKTLTKLQLAEAARQELVYHYWARAEHEILISAWVGGNGEETLKVDIYSQVMLNWEKFVEYLWELRNEKLYDIED